MTLSSRKKSIARTIILVLFVIAWINPYVEKLNGESALVFMFSHYALCLSGLLLGFYNFKWPSYLWILGAAIISLWHFPLPFAFSAALLNLRLLEESTIFFGGLLVGSNLRSMKQSLKTTLFVMWIISDTILSGIFIVDPSLFSSIPGSPFANAQLVVTGVAMALFMNIAIGYMLFIYFRRFQRIQNSLAKSYQ